MSGSTGQFGNPFRRVASGERMDIPAAAWNRVLEAADLIRRSRGTERQASRRVRSSGLVLVRNDSGAAVGQFGILGIDDFLVDPSDNETQFRQQVLLSGVDPDDVSHRGKFVVTLQPMADGAVGLACASGLVQVKVNMQAAAHQFADVADGDTAKLASGDTGGAQILVVAGTSGEQWAIVRLGPEPGGVLKKGTLVGDETLIAGDNVVSVTPDGGTSPGDDVDVHVYEGSGNVVFDPADTVTGKTIWYQADSAGDYQYVKGFGLAWYYGDDA